MPGKQRTQEFFERFDAARDEVFAAIAEGAFISGADGVARRFAGCSPQTLYEWKDSRPELSAAFDAARRLSACSFDEQALRVLQDLRASGERLDTPRVKLAGLESEQHARRARAFDPETFAEKAQTQVNIGISAEALNLTWVGALRDSAKQLQAAKPNGESPALPASDDAGEADA